MGKYEFVERSDCDLFWGANLRGREYNHEKNIFHDTRTDIRIRNDLNVCEIFGFHGDEYSGL